MTIFTRLTTIIALALGTVTGVAQAQENLVDDILARGKLRVGMSTFVPWAMRDKNGELIGFEIDVAKEVAKDMGVELELVPTQWDGIIPALLTGKFDVIIGGMSITPERNLKINFSRPYAQSGLLIVANKERAGKFTSRENYNSDKVSFAMRRGVTAVDAVKKLFPQAERRLFDEEATALQEVINGSATAWVSASPSAATAIADNEGKLFTPFLETFDNSNEGFGLRKGDPDAMNFFNNWILTKLESGWLEERHTHWFKTRNWADQLK